MPKKKPYKLSKNARADVKNIMLYTLREHGIGAADKYHTELKSTFSLIENNPRIGIIFSTRRKTMRRFVFRQHNIYYKERSAEILILRILHHKQDPTQHL